MSDRVAEATNEKLYANETDFVKLCPVELIFCLLSIQRWRREATARFYVIFVVVVLCDMSDINLHIIIIFILFFVLFAELDVAAHSFVFVHMCDRFTCATDSICCCSRYLCGGLCVCVCVARISYFWISGNDFLFNDLDWRVSVSVSVYDVRSFPMNRKAKKKNISHMCHQFNSIFFSRFVYRTSDAHLLYNNNRHLSS